MSVMLFSNSLSYMMGALLSALSTIPTLLFIRSLLHKTHTKEQSAFFMQHCAHLKNKKTKRITCLCTVDYKKETKNTVLLLAVENQSNISAVMFQSNLAATLGLGNNGNMFFSAAVLPPDICSMGLREQTHTQDWCVRAEESLQWAPADLTFTPAGIFQVDLSAVLRIKDGSSRNGGQEGIQHFSF